MSSPPNSPERETDRPEVVAPAGSVWSTVRFDFASAPGLQVLIVAALVGWLAFQWGFGNDALLPSIAATVFDRIEDGDTWTRGITAALAAGAAGFAFWAVTQTLDAIVVLTGLRYLPATTARISAYLNRKGWVKPYHDLSWSARWAIAYAAGASAVALVDVFATGTPGIAGRRRMITAAVLLSAGSVGVIVAFVSALAVVSLRIPATEPTAEVLIRYAKNPLTWLVIIGVVIGGGKLRSMLRRRLTTS